MNNDCPYGTTVYRGHREFEGEKFGLKDARRLSNVIIHKIINKVKMLTNEGRQLLRQENCKQNTA